MRSAAFVVPGTLASRTGGYIYDSRVIDGLRACGWSVAVHEIAGDFPFPSPDTLRRTADVLAAISPATVTLVDGLAFGAMPSIVETHAARLRFVPIVHLPLAADVGLDSASASALLASETRALAAARRVIVTGTATLDMLRAHGVPVDRIVVAEPGTDPAPIARGGAAGPLELLCVATLNPGKGHDVLLRALASCGDGWHLTCAGSLSRHPATVDGIRLLIAQLGLEERVTLAGELDPGEMEAAYDRSDAFVLATRRETYGMAVAEALAHGLPVVSTRTGAISDLVGDDAGMLVRPGDVEALGDALARLIGDADLRASLRQGALGARERLPSWEVTASIISATLE